MKTTTLLALLLAVVFPFAATIGTGAVAGCTVVGLICLARGSARLESRDHVDAADLAIVQRVAFDTLPPQRSAVMRSLLNGKMATSATTGLKRHALDRAVEDLRELDLLNDHGALATETRNLAAISGLLTT